MTRGLQIFYRGLLDSCNYSCSYCPFSKNKMSRTQIEKDREKFSAFVNALEEQLKQHAALLLVPYGEALIHRYYWEGMGRLCRQPFLDAVGAQTNLSFPVEKMLELFRENGGKIEKLRLWCTFHPSMADTEEFAANCKELTKAGVSLCVGAVAEPEEMSRLWELKKKLPSTVYMWLNKMDGFSKKYHRSYSEEEIRMFREFDAYFDLECGHYKADISKCFPSVFVGEGEKISRCNLSVGRDECGRSECSCYLAYSNRKDIGLLKAFGEYPAFRIPEQKFSLFKAEEI